MRSQAGNSVLTSCQDLAKRGDRVYQTPAKPSCRRLTVPAILAQLRILTPPETRGTHCHKTTTHDWRTNSLARFSADSSPSPTVKANGVIALRLTKVDENRIASTNCSECRGQLRAILGAFKREWIRFVLPPFDTDLLMALTC